MDSSRSRWTGLCAGLLIFSAGLAWAAPPVATPLAQPESPAVSSGRSRSRTTRPAVTTVAAGPRLSVPVFPLIEAPANKPVLTLANGVKGAPTSHLPVLEGADVWVDAEGADPTAKVGPGAPPVNGPIIQHVALLVVRPRGDNLKWDDLRALYVRAGLIQANEAPVLHVLEPVPPQSAPGANARESKVYGGRTPSERLVLGMIVNLRTKHQLVYAAMLSGKMDNAQAKDYAQTVAEDLAGRVQADRDAVPTPAGSVADGREQRFEGALLRQLFDNIVGDPSTSQRVKDMARVVFPQATSLRVSVWRTQEALSDQAFFDFYTQQASRLGWGAPISKDETQPGHPVLLFQRPRDEGVVMVRAQAAPAMLRNGVALRAATRIIALRIEGKIDATALLQK